MHHIVIFASGKGTNAAAIIDYFKQHQLAKVALIICNNPQAGVLELAQKENIPSIVVNRSEYGGENMLRAIEQCNPSLLVLAGFLWKIPETVVKSYAHKIINIHPALLPTYGGKGMYGMHVHQAVLQAGEKSSGTTIHYVNEHYDEGEVIMQAQCAVLPNDTGESLANRIHQLEHFYLPRTIHFLLTSPTT